MKDLWSEKYRPKTIADYVWMDENQKEQVERWVADKSIPHLLLSGSPGTGKTTLAKALIQELGVLDQDVMELNSSSKDRGVSVIQNKVTNFASTMPFGDFKVVLMDEADGLTQDAQGAMRGTMEMYADNCRFVLTCNYPHKIIPALHSRAQGFHIAKLDYEQFTLRVAQILINEGVEFDLEVLEMYISGCYPDMRKCINQLENASVSGVLQSPSNVIGNGPEYRTKMVELFKAGKILEARKLAADNIRPDEVEDMFRWMYDNLDLWSSTQAGKDKAVTIIRDGLVNQSMIADVEINLSATLVELTTIDE